MTSYASSSMALQDRVAFDFNAHVDNSDSESEQQQLMMQQNLQHSKKSKKIIDIEAIKGEIGNRPPMPIQPVPLVHMKRQSKTSLRQLSTTIIPTSPILIEQLNNIRSFKHLKEEVPPEIMNKVYSELRYEYVQAQTTVYRQGDHNKKYYFLLDGKCVVMKPKERMVGSLKVDADEKIQLNNALRKSEVDPYGLKSAFPEYLLLKVLFPGEYDLFLFSSFGEAAIKLDISRASTVLALENTHLLYLSEEAFFHLLDPYLSKSLDEKIHYFNNFPIFSQVETSEIMGILLECKQHTYKAGEIVYDENQKPKYFYFIISGQVELSKQVGKKNLVMSSYGEYQQFGEVEIMNKTNRFTKAKAITPRMIVYQIRRNKFFDNLGNYQLFEVIKRNSNMIYKHWEIIYNQAKSTQNTKDEIYQAAQDAQSNRPNPLSKQIVNKKIIEGQGQKLNQVKVFQTLTESGNSVYTSPNRGILQRVYSNTLQQYQARLLKKPQQTQSNCDECVRSVDNTQIFSQNNKSNRSFTDRNQGRQINELRSSSHVKLPSIPSPKVQPQTLDSVLESISRLPRVPRDNLVISLMYQQAYKSENPDKKAKQIQQVIQASFRNVRKQIEHTKEESNIPKHKSNEALIRNLKLDELLEDRRLNTNFVNFVQQKKIFN